MSVKSVMLFSSLACFFPLHRSFIAAYLLSKWTIFVQAFSLSAYFVLVAFFENYVWRTKKHKTIYFLIIRSAFDHPRYQYLWLHSIYETLEILDSIIFIIFRLVSIVRCKDIVVIWSVYKQNIRQNTHTITICNGPFIEAKLLNQINYQVKKMENNMFYFILNI